MTHSNVLARLTLLQDEADRFHAEELTLAELTAELDKVAQRRADAQERVEKLRPSAELLTRANTVLDELLKSHDAAQPPSRFAGIFDSLFGHSQFGHVPAASTTEAAPAEEPTPVSELVPEEAEASAEPEDAPQPDPVEDAPSVEPTPAGQENSELEEVALKVLHDAPPVAISVRVCEYLETHPGTTVTLTAAALGVPRNAVGSVVARMLASGEIEAVENSWPPIYKLKGVEYTPPVTGPEQEKSTQEEASQNPPPVVSPGPKAPVQKQPSETPAGKLRDVADRQVIQSSPTAQAPLAPSKVKPVTDAEERAVLAALIARPNGKGSAALLSNKAQMATSRVTEVLEHLAEQNLVVRPEEGQLIWSRK